MKFALALISAAFAGASASSLPIFGSPKKSPRRIKQGDGIAADSELGHKLLSKARRLENDEEIDFTWVANYSIKFQGCHHISQFNEEADGEEDVRIYTKRLVRFRLCPAEYCSLENNKGCDSGYGDYIIDMNTFIAAYMEYKEEYYEWYCENLEQKYENGYLGDYQNCGNCQNDDEEYCKYDCFMEIGGEAVECIENNPYEDDEEEEFDLEEYMECARFEANNNRRKLDQNEVEYFVGPYCAEQGGAIYLGLFTDETCTTFADDNAGKDMYYSMAGDFLPYSEATIIGMDCLSCMEPKDEDENNGNGDNADEDEVREMCEEIYSTAGKCETNLDGIAAYPNENACNYIEGIKIVRKDGIVVQSSAKSNKTASIFIGIFAASFVILGGYVYYLKTKLDRAKINLSDA